MYKMHGKKNRNEKKNSKRVRMKREDKLGKDNEMEDRKDKK